jgi:hypothetical protein
MRAIEEGNIHPGRGIDLALVPSHKISHHAPFSSQLEVRGRGIEVRRVKRGSLTTKRTKITKKNQRLRVLRVLGGD